jgi:hypothetical protein
MLASTMQFSNNQHSRKQPHSLRTQQRAQPDRSVQHFPRRSSTHEHQPTMPNSQRSTHEQPAPDTRR